jgi:hypothetical protein
MVTADILFRGATVKCATLNVQSIQLVVATEDRADSIITTNNHNTTIDENVQNAVVPINSPYLVGIHNNKKSQCI